MSTPLAFEAKPKKPIKDMTPDEEKAHRAEQAKGDRWNRQHPVRIKHVVAHWDGATEDEKKTGESWYEDSHHLAKHIANDTHQPMHVVAGLISNYSPQTHWATNIHTAARVARKGQAEGGPGSGIMASSSQKRAAERMLNGEHYDKVLAGPKTRAFAHLIEHGGNHHDDEQDHVVIDRHALSVAAGTRASDTAYERSRLGTKGRYDEVSKVYRKAAKIISKKEGRHISPHQVQAVTWITRQRMNENDDIETSKSGSSGSAVLARQAVAKWNEYAGEHHPALLGKIPGTGYAEHHPDDVKHYAEMADEGATVIKHGGLMDRMAYGETKAPVDVDTLRESECPVCGNDESWDGDRCMVCGFFRPPQMFMDPNTDVARAMDLRKDIADQNGLPGNPGEVVGSDPGQANGGGGLALPPANPDDLTEDGMIGDGTEQPPIGIDQNDQADPNGIASADAQSAANGLEVPGPIGPDGLPVVDPEAATGHFQQGGEAFTPGPNAPVPAEPMDPAALDDEGQPIEPGQDGQQVAPESGEPGTPQDSTPDLVCPACGFESGAQQPMSQGNSPMDPAGAGDGMLEGDLCPQCQKGLMSSISTMMQGGPVA